MTQFVIRLLGLIAGLCWFTLCLIYLARGNYQLATVYGILYLGSEVSTVCHAIKDNA